MINEKFPKTIQGTTNEEAKISFKKSTSNLRKKLDKIF